MEPPASETERNSLIKAVDPEMNPPNGHEMKMLPEKHDVAVELVHMEPGVIPPEPVEVDDHDLDDDDDDSDWENAEEQDEEVLPTDNKEVAVKQQNSFLLGRIISGIVEKFQQIVKFGYGTLQKLTRGYFVTIVALILYFIYLIIALAYRNHDTGAKWLIGFTVFGVFLATKEYIFMGMKWLFQKVNGSDKPSPKMVQLAAMARPILRWVMYALMAVFCLFVVIDEGKDDIKNLRSLPGLLAMVLCCLLMSQKPSKINWHTIYWSLGLQFLMAYFALRWDLGRDSIFWIQDRLDEFFDNAKEGSKLLFGEGYEEHYLIFGAIPLFIFINSAITILYYLGAMQFVIRTVGSLLGFVLGTTPIESMSVAAGIFLESVTALSALIPYLPRVTRSQLFLVMTSTFASIGGAYLAMLSRLQVPMEHMIAAMVISAPATFCVCKLIMPETQKLQLEDGEIDVGSGEKKKYGNVLDAAQAGANIMIGMLANVVANIFAMWSFISYINSTFTWFGDRVGIDELTFEDIASYVLYPFSLAMGVETEDCRNVAMLLGYRISSSSLLAYIKMTQMKVNRYKFLQYMATTNFTGPIVEENNDVILTLWNETLKDGFINERSEAIATYSLAGFSSFVSAAVCLGILCVILPKRKAWMAKHTFLALIAGNIANCMTGCFASLFY